MLNNQIILSNIGQALVERSILLIGYRKSFYHEIFLIQYCKFLMWKGLNINIHSPYDWFNTCIVLNSIDGWNNILYFKESLIFIMKHNNICYNPEWLDQLMQINFRNFIPHIVNMDNFGRFSHYLIILLVKSWTWIILMIDFYSNWFGFNLVGEIITKGDSLESLYLFTCGWS